MKRIKVDKIHLLAINVYKADINCEPEYMNQPIEPAEIKVGFSQESAFNFEENKIRIRLNVELIGIDDKAEDVGLSGEYGIEFHYHVGNFDDFIEEDNGKKHISGILGGTLIGLSFSTARGIILDRTQGTFFNGAILPVIDPNSLLKEA